MSNQNIILQLIWHEENIMRDFLLEITAQNPTNEPFSQEELAAYNLIRKDDYNAMALAHRYFMQEILNAVTKIYLEKEGLFSLYHFDYKSTEVIDYQLFANKKNDDIREIFEQLHTNFLNSEFVYQQGKLKRIKSKINLKETGSVYTQCETAEAIAWQSIQNAMQEGSTAEAMKILDFGCGTGRFYWSAFRLLHQKLGVSKSQIVQNMFAIDINDIALSVLKIGVLLEVGFEYWDTINQNILHRNMLMLKNAFDFQTNNYLDLQNDFASVLTNGGFDAIISNPPYFLLKINKNNTTDETYQKYYEYLTDKINIELQYFRNAGVYQHSIEGMLNYYKLSIEMMLKLTKNKGDIGIICPSTLFGDVSSSKLRRFILNQNQLRQLEFLPENAKLFDNVSQATAIFHISKGQKTSDISVKFKENTFKIPYDLIKTTFAENLEIPQMDEIGWDILQKLSKFKPLKAYKNLRNRRGEFDLLQFKNLITKEPTDFRLIRGNMINSTKIEYEKGDEYVEIEAFKQAKSQEFIKNDFQKVRLVCQQISNIDIAKRLKFVFCSENDILGNSCNYIAMQDVNDLKNLNILLNSQLLNWRFKVTSTNNHINNYELDELPLIDFSNFSKNINGNELKNNIEIAKMYNLDKNQIMYLLEYQFDSQEIKNYL